MPRKMGRPTKLRQLVTVPVDGNETRKIRIGQHVCELIESYGLRPTLMADMAGVDRATIRSWLKKGSEAEIKAEKGHLLTPDEQHHLDFLIETRAAHARWMADRLGTHTSIAKGGLTISEVIQEVDPTTIVTRDDGSRGPKILKTRTKTQRLLPDPISLRWELERLATDVDGARVFAPRVEVTGEGGGPVIVDDKEERGAALARELAAFQAGVDTAAAIEAERNGVTS